MVIERGVSEGFLASEQKRLEKLEDALLRAIRNGRETPGQMREIVTLRYRLEEPTRFSSVLTAADEEEINRRTEAALAILNASATPHD